MRRVEYAKVTRPHYREHVSGDAAVVGEKGHLLFAAIVDVLGHGREAHELAVDIEKFLVAQRIGPVVALMDRLHEYLTGTRGAVAGLCLLDPDSGLLRYTGTGNIVIRRFGSAEVRLLSRPGIVGGSRRTPREEQMRLTPGDVVLLYTDGIKDRFELSAYPQLLHHSAEAVAKTIVGRFGKDYDDASCIALRYQK